MSQDEVGCDGEVNVEIFQGVLQNRLVVSGFRQIVQPPDTTIDSNTPGISTTKEERLIVSCAHIMNDVMDVFS